MRTVTTIAETRAILDRARRGGATVGLVPTMGFLHAGHASLIERAATDCDLTVVTIFVNPLQFGAGEDLEAYPHDTTGDAALAERCGADVVLMPSTAEMYPQPVLTSVGVAEISSRLEGVSRPTHFAGVATVVAKLFNIAGPCRAYFGEKDFQQIVVVRRMASDLSFPVQVVGCPTVREPDGLALSSRNAYLTPEERAAAPVVHRALQAGVAAVEHGERDPAVVRRVVGDLIEAEPTAELDYAEVVDAATLAAVEPLSGTLRILVAARFGRARLIDNVEVVAD